MFLLKNTLVGAAALLAVVCVSVASTHADDTPVAESKQDNAGGVAEYMGYGANGLGYGYNPQPNQNMVPPYPNGGNQGGNYYGGNGFRNSGGKAFAGIIPVMTVMTAGAFIGSIILFI